VPVQVAEQLLFQIAVVCVGRTLFRSSRDVVRDLCADVCESLMMRLRVTYMRSQDATPTATRHADGDEPDLGSDCHRRET
jgi:hypothetical protein